MKEFELTVKVLIRANTKEEAESQLQKELDTLNEYVENDDTEWVGAEIVA